jgi:hypothetical protein
MTSTSIYQEPVLSYVYRLDNPTTGEFYFGFRKANKVPANQDLGIDYFTSSKTVEPRFQEFNYTIIQEFVDPLEAYDLEQFLIYQELKNPLMLNRRCHHGSKIRFTTSGKKQSEESNAKRSASAKGKPAHNKGKPGNRGISKNKGIPKPEGFGAKLSSSTKGIPKPEGFGAKLSSSTKGIPKPEGFGAKLSYVKTGIPKPEGFGNKLSATKKGKKQPNISAAKKGIPQPKFLSIIETRKTYTKPCISRLYPEFKQYF